nr:helix-turn-helix domain-containing protein [Cellulosimicrobium sp. SH8]
MDTMASRPRGTVAAGVSQSGPRGGTDGGTGLGPDVFSADCPSRLVVERIGDKWTLLVFMALRRRVLRFGELRDLVGVVTPKVLTQTLRSLERDGLVQRTVYAEVPPRVEYALTDLGRSLLGPIDAIRAWSEENGERIAASRAAASDRAGA